LKSCLHCGEERNFGFQKHQLQFHYWSPLKQIRLEIISPQRRESFLYRHHFLQRYASSPSSPIIEDFFNGKLFYDVDSVFHLENEFDFCFSISTDGFQAFKK